jgi:hypothetical protein
VILCYICCTCITRGIITSEVCTGSVIWHAQAYVRTFSLHIRTKVIHCHSDVNVGSDPRDLFTRPSSMSRLQQRFFVRTAFPPRIIYQRVHNRSTVPRPAVFEPSRPGGLIASAHLGFQPVPKLSSQHMSSALWPRPYPATRRSDHVDVYESAKEGKVRIADPYEWLEHDSAETAEWITAQEQFTREFLDANPERKALEDQIRENMDYAKVGSCARATLYRHLTYPSSLVRLA